MKNLNLELVILNSLPMLSSLTLKRKMVLLALVMYGLIEYDTWTKSYNLMTYL